MEKAMLEDEARATLERMREALFGFITEADRLHDGLLGVKLSEVIDVINNKIGADLR